MVSHRVVFVLCLPRTATRCGTKEWERMGMEAEHPFQPQEAEERDAPWAEGGCVTPEKGQTCGHIWIQNLDSGKDKTFPETILQFIHLLYLPLIRTDFYQQLKLSAEWCSSEECPTLGSVYTVFTMVPTSHLHCFPKSNKPDWSRARFEWESGSIKGQLFWEGGQRLPNQRSRN